MGELTPLSIVAGRLNDITAEMAAMRREAREDRELYFDKLDIVGTVANENTKVLVAINERHRNEDSLRAPWYKAIVGAIVACIAGVLGALVALWKVS